MLNKFTKLCVLTGTAMFSIYAANATIEADTVTVSNNSEVSIAQVKNKSANVLFTSKDSQGRPLESHFIGNDANEVGHRVGAPDIPSNMTRWVKNPRVKTANGGYTYFWNRGHLVGNQFASASSNNGDNIVAETEYMNQKLMTYYEGGMSSSNENALDNWMFLHPNYYIDYYVKANYANSDDSIPQSVTLRFRGLDSNNKPIEIRLPEQKAEGVLREDSTANMFSEVELANIEPGYKIDYKTGEFKAGKTNTVTPSSNKQSNKTGFKINASNDLYSLIKEFTGEVSNSTLIGIIAIIITAISYVVYLVKRMKRNRK